MLCPNPCLTTNFFSKKRTYACFKETLQDRNFARFVLWIDDMGLEIWEIESTSEKSHACHFKAHTIDIYGLNVFKI